MEQFDAFKNDEFPLKNYKWPRPHIIDQTDFDLLRRALDSDDWSHANIANEFQSAFAKYIGCKHALLVPNGTSAIYLSLVAGGIRPGQEVIIPGITWPSVVYAILKAGGVPRTVDISRDSLCVDAQTILPAVTKNTFAIIPTHLFGSQCKMQEISDLAAAHNVHVIEDAAQSIGSSQSGKRCGSWGLAGAFSLNDRKVLACGEGGCITTNNTDFYKELLRIQLILPERHEKAEHLPGTYKVSEFQAAVALAQLGKLDSTLSLMEENANILDRLLGVEGLIQPQQKPENVDRQSYYSYCFHIDGISDIRLFRAFLAAKLNIKIVPPYVPLCDISDLRPSSQPLADIVAENLSTRHSNCMTAYYERSARFPFYVLQTGKTEMEMICATISKALNVYQN